MPTWSVEGLLLGLRFLIVSSQADWARDLYGASSMRALTPFMKGTLMTQSPPRGLTFITIKFEG